MPSPGRFFDAELIARLSRLELTAKRVVDGFLAGKNRSNRHGFSVEFVEHREYAPGDDLRHLDWKVLGRMDRYYVKRYEEETNITAFLLVDSSASMTYASDGMTKFELAAFAAASFSYLLNRQRDAVGLGFFDTELRACVPPSAKRVAVAAVARALQEAAPKGRTSLEGVIERVTHDVPHRALFVLISDLFLPPASLAAALRLLEHRGHDAIVLQTLDAAELSFPFGANVLFRGLEDRRELLTEPERLRQRYLEALERFLGDVRRAAEASAYDYALLSTGEPLAPALAALLAARARRRQTARRACGR
jgi:uncharacterized protein (DUF58 family)